ncbi:MAG: peptidoglycan-binding domain-containing protein, partial [Microcystis sp.]
MATLQDIINNNKTLNRSQLKADKGLVIEIQTKLANLGFYPGGGWIDGDLGEFSSFSWTGLIDFCKKVAGLPIPSDTMAINKDIAQKLLTIKQVESVLQTATQNSILTRLQQIQTRSPIINKNTPPSAFVSRSIEQSPFRPFIVNYPNFLTQKPDGTSLISYGDNFTFSDGRTVDFNDYPNCGSQPNIDNNGLNFLPSNISHACLCIGSFKDSNSPIKARWLGK